MFITNVAIFCLTIVWIATIRQFSDIGRLMLLAAYILGGSTYYLRWPGPEILVGSLSLVGLVLLLAGRRFGAGLALAIAAQHDPPVGILALVPLGGLCLTALRQWRSGALSVRDVTAPLVVAAVLVASPVYFYLRFGFPNPHAAFGHAESHFVSAERVLDLLFSPDLGVVRAMPWLFPALAAVTIALAYKGFGKKALIIVTSSLVAAAALAAAASSTNNWNSGMVVFSRYAVFAAVPLYVGLAYAFDMLATKAAARRIASAILAVFAMGQLVTVAIYGGFGSGVGYTSYSRLSAWLLENLPSTYNPIPETFIERGIGREAVDKGEVYVFARDGQITKIAFNERADMTTPLCGKSLHALQGEPDYRSVPKEDGWTYMNPQVPCPTDIGDGFSIVKPLELLDVYAGGRIGFATDGTGAQYLFGGWSHPETWGVWSQANNASLKIPFRELHSDRLRVAIHMAAFDRGDGKGQQVRVSVGEVSRAMRLAGEPQTYDFDIVNPAGTDGSGVISVNFNLPEATAPQSVGNSDDPRLLGVALRDISIVESR